MREPLLRPALAFCAGIALYRWSGIDAAWSTAAFAALFLLALWKARRLVALCGLLLMAGAGAFIAGVREPGPPPLLNAETGETVLLEGCVVEPPLFHDGREQFTLELAPAARVQVSLLLDRESESPAWRYGQRVEFPARIRHPRNFGNPGAFDYVGYLARRNIYWTATAKPGPDLKLLPGDCGHALRAALFNLRQAALERTSQLFGSSRYHEALLDALLIGEASRLERAWTDDYRRTGTYHALVISGLHITVIAASLLFLCRLCFLSREAGLALTAAITWTYAALSGGSPPAVRAAAVFTLFAAASYLHRRGSLLNLLAASAFAVLLWDPAQLFDPGFQMSFMAVAAIGALAQPVLDATTERWRNGLKHLARSQVDHKFAPDIAEARLELRYFCEAVGLPRLIHAVEALLRLGRWAWSTTAVTALVQIALLLPMIFYFHRVSVTSVAANLIAVPLLTLCVPLGFITLLIGSAPLATLTSALVDTARTLVEWHASFEPSARLPEPPWEVAAAVGVVLIIAACRRHVAMTALAAIVSIGLQLASFRTGDGHGGLRLQALDVGQGDSLLVRLPDGRRMLVDGGGIPTFGKARKPAMDIGEDVVSPYLWRLGVRTVDIVAVTHAHEDHAGGLRALIENFRPRELWAGANGGDSEAWQRLSGIAKSFGVTIRPMIAGAEWHSGGIEFRVLSPSRDYQPGPAPRNDDSLVLQLRYGRHRFLLTGDVERPSEMLLVERLENIDVLKVAHHGSRTSTTEEFLAATRPAVAIISAGDGNLYRHPHPEVLRRLGSRRTAVYRTDRMGMIDVRSDGRYLEVQPFRWPSRAE